MALVSVVGSSSLALGSLTFGYLNSREQRKHEASLAFEGRAWERKSDALFRAIRAARATCDTFTPHGDGVTVETLRQVENLRAELQEIGPVIEAYGSTRARDDLRATHEVLRDTYFEPGWLPDLTEIRQQKADSIEDQDFDRAALLRKQEELYTEKLFESVRLDRVRLESALLSLIESSRHSVRSDVVGE